ncbi:MAG: hypothetical protein HQL13_02315 [Candidatus Omnitrophica bacterium]|nr:hypothetical protein [Candidatus Omnitrophota bacterium]
MRVIGILILGIIFLFNPGWAMGKDVSGETALLKQALAQLKSTEQTMNLDNDLWRFKNKTKEEEVRQLQAKLQRLKGQGEAFNQSSDNIEEIKPGQQKQIDHLKEILIDLDHRIQKVNENIQFAKQSLDEENQEYQKSLSRLKEVKKQVEPPVESSDQKEKLHRQKERLRLMKMIDHSQERQESLHTAILNLQKKSPVVFGEEMIAHQKFLKEQIQALESQIAAYPPKGVSLPKGSANQWNSKDLSQMEDQLKFLEENYGALKLLVEQMSQKTKGLKVPVTQSIEEKKLETSLKDLNLQGTQLKVELDGLRAQMVHLDKLKTHLEKNLSLAR